MAQITLVSLCIIALLSMTALSRTTLAVPIQVDNTPMSPAEGVAASQPQPLQQHAKPHRAAGAGAAPVDGGRLRVEVPRRLVPFYPGGSVTVYCRVTGGNKADEYPRVSFYYQMNKFTIMPLGSGSQGVAIRTKVAAARNVTSVESDVHRVTNLLELGPELYGVLREGDNHFYCKGSLSNGRSVREFFVVRKVPVRAAHLHPLWTA